jgi:hypothetical protein
LEGNTSLVGFEFEFRSEDADAEVRMSGEGAMFCEFDNFVDVRASGGPGEGLEWQYKAWIRSKTSNITVFGGTRDGCSCVRKSLK